MKKYTSPTDIHAKVLIKVTLVLYGAKIKIIDYNQWLLRPCSSRLTIPNPAIYLINIMPALANE